MWDQTPFDQVERALACLAVLPNDQQFLAWRSIVARANVAHPAVADSETFNNSEAKRPGTLDDTSAHAVRINQRLLLGGSFEWAIEGLELPQEQTSLSPALMSPNDPKRTRRAGSKSFGQGRLP